MKKWKKAILFLVLGAILVLGGGYSAYKGYRYVRQVRLVKQAKAFLEKSEERKALLCIQRALSLNPRDLEAVRLMAELLENGRNPAAVFYRNRIVELNPKSTSDRLELVRTALRFNDIGSATNALEAVDSTVRNTVEYHDLAAKAAATAGAAAEARARAAVTDKKFSEARQFFGEAAAQVAKAEEHYAEAARLDPANPVYELYLASIRIRSTNTDVAITARSKLRLISENPTNSLMRCQALRELTTDAGRRQDFTSALGLTRQLLQETNSSFSDKLLQLEILQQSKSAEFRPALAACANEAVTNIGKAFSLANWQMANTSPADALALLQSLPAELKTNGLISLTVAQCHDALKDWVGLQSSLARTNQNWGDFEFLRHAYIARGLRGQNLVSASKAEWDLAVKVANVDDKNAAYSGLNYLLNAAKKWDWASEKEELLWTIVNRFPEAKDEVRALTEILYLGGRTRPLMTLSSQQSKRNPKDLAARNNLALCALLLEAQEMKPQDLAREVYQAQPTNASFASTYAFALHLQKKDAEALKVMKTLSPTDLQEPAVAGYYGLILKAVGDTNGALAYLPRAFNGLLLPEEKKLFQQARAGL